jgi:hypothetical protein
MCSPDKLGVSLAGVVLDPGWVFRLEPPWGLEPQPYALRVASGTSTGVVASPAGIRQCLPRSISDRPLGCSVGCSDSQLGKTCDGTPVDQVKRLAPAADCPFVTTDDIPVGTHWARIS